MPGRAGRPNRVALAWLLLCQGCQQGAATLGSDLVWRADAETGDLSAWTLDGRGGTYELSSDFEAAVSSEEAHGGRYSVRLSNAAAGADGGGGLYREDAFPQNAYYSAWYFVPRPYQTVTGWTVMRFAVRHDAADVLTTLGLVLYSRPDGGLELRVNDYRSEYLQAPLADPPPLVPVARWFQIEALFRNSADAAGGLVVWIDGVRRYEIERPMEAP